MIKKITVLLLSAILAMSLAGCKASEETTTTEPRPFSQFDMPLDNDDIAVISTEYGDVKIRLFPEYAPKAVENFVTHAKDGYYNGLLFHRVINDFMVQTGDPLGTGAGGESIWKENFAIEVAPQLHHYRGALAMAHSSQPTSNGSQFYVVQSKTASEEFLKQLEGLKTQEGEYTVPESGAKFKLSEMFSDADLSKYREVGGYPMLDYFYTVFGQVISGMDVIDKIAAVEVGEEDRPVKDIKVDKVEILKYKDAK